MSDDIQILCNIAQASRSGYYKWLKRDKNKDEDDYLLIKEIFNKGKCKLGWRPIKMKLKLDHNIIMNHKKIKRIKREKNLITKIRRKNPYKMIMKKTQEHRVFDNLLDRKFEQNAPGKVFCTDITYLYYIHGRKAYLQVIKDIATKEIVSWQLSNSLSMKFVLKSIEMLKSVKTLSNKSIIHSDQGFHYTNPEYIKKVKTLKLIQSMSRKGNCIDNSPIESFFGHLKDDIDYKQAKTFKQLNTMVNTYMNYYNNERYQWELKKMTPVQYRDNLLSQKS
ncbi:MAG: IS3 family transposase [Parcubacteria group bacterium]|nr:IS3 family transposase [Parcubacteria group bacterium]